MPQESEEVSNATDTWLPIGGEAKKSYHLIKHRLASRVTFLPWAEWKMAKDSFSQGGTNNECSFIALRGKVCFPNGGVAALRWEVFPLQVL